MTDFQELGLHEPLLKAITELGYEEPTPIQAQTIRQVLAGVDVIAQAQTGTGKTAAFALPIIQKIEAAPRQPQALVLTPTRELAVQVAEAFHSYAKYSPVSVLPVYGGQPIERQLRALDRGVQVVVGTPGRVLDHIRRGTLKLETVCFVVLDEADEMLDMGFIEDIETILKSTPPDRQTMLFSATMPAPIARLAQRYLRNPVRITVAADQLTVPQIRQVYYDVGKRDKFEVLARVLDYEAPTSAIIFCRTKRAVDDVGQRLTARACSAETLHGDLNQVQRDRVMARFRAGQVEILVATDVAARGLDIENVTHVINFDIPLDPEAYVHRIGRTGRAGRTGVAVTLVTPRERRQLRQIEQVTNSTIQRMNLPTIADVIAQRREAFKETIRETISGDGLEPYTIMVEELGEEYGPCDLAAAAFKLLLHEPAIPAEDRLAEEEQPEPRAGRREPRSGQRQNTNRRFGPEEGMTRIFVDIGRGDGVRPADFVGAIANEAGIPGRAIGAIDLYEHFSFVEVPAPMANRVIDALQRTTIRGRRLAPTLARPQQAA